MKNKKYILLVLVFLLCGTSLMANVTTDEKISLQFDEVSITTVLNMIARQFNLNLVVSTQVEENISIRLDNVGLDDALMAILTPNGYNYYRSGNIIIVKPFEMPVTGETVVKAITLDYVSPGAVVNAVEMLLSPKGKIKIIKNPEPGSNSFGEPIPTRIVIVDVPEAIDLVVDFIEEIDRPEPQVAIEVKMIEMNVDGQTNVGFQWPTEISTRFHGISAGSESEGTSSTEALGQIDLPDGSWEWGKLSTAEVELMLEFLEKQGNSKLISDPRISTLNDHTAEIKVATVVPIQTINRFSEGGAVQDIVTFQDEEVGITLLVTPHVLDDGRIILDVNPTVAEIIGYSGTVDNQKPITSERSIRTKITVKNNESAVLGGLLKENKIEKEQKVFFLGSLPIIGGLFKHKSVQTSTTDLMILITPTIIKE